MRLRPSMERHMAARARRVMVRVALSIVAGVCLVICAFWVYAVVTGGRYM